MYQKAPCIATAKFLWAPTMGSCPFACALTYSQYIPYTNIYCYHRRFSIPTKPVSDIAPILHPQNRKGALLMKHLLPFLLSACLCLSLGAAYAQEEQPAHGLIVSEIMASNHLTLEDAFGRFPDWIELYNTTDQALPLKGVSVSDNKSELQRYTFPEDAVIKPGEYLIVFASGAKKDIADEYHASFKLSATGEAVYISSQGILIDAVFFEEQQSDISWALDERGEYRMTTTPTPGGPNIITEM